MNRDRFAGRVLAWEAVTGAVTPVLLDALAPAPGERLLDVGSGAGAATLRAAELVGPGGAVVGADVSAPVVALARERARAAHARNVTFQVADAQLARLRGSPFTAAMSQFGVMFFADPAAAFANVRAHLRPSGRLCFACWQDPAANPWSFAALLADVLPPRRPADGVPPGPFSLGDEDRVHTLLCGAGFVDVDVTVHRGRVDVAEECVVDDGELGVMGVAPDRLAEAHQRVAAYLAPYRTPSGLLRLPLRYLVVRARADG